MACSLGGNRAETPRGMHVIGWSEPCSSLHPELGHSTAAAGGSFRRDFPECAVTQASSPQQAQGGGLEKLPERKRPEPTPHDGGVTKKDALLISTHRRTTGQAAGGMRTRLDKAGLGCGQTTLAAEIDDLELCIWEY